MGVIDLAEVGAGFADPVFDSQRAYRDCLATLSRPGTLACVATPEDVVRGLWPAAGALLLALLDQDTRLWLSPSLANGRVESSLRFHTGCAMVASPGAADFALVAAPHELPALEAFAAGTDEHPERSTTLVLQVPALSTEGGWRLTGPGIQAQAQVRAEGLGAAFLAQWEANRQRFPRGIDLFLSSGDRLCGLPRTTRIEG